MIRSVTFEIKGRPVPWKRMRRNGKRSFPADGQNEAKCAIKLACQREMAKLGMSTALKHVPVSMSVFAVFSLPQTIPKGDPRRMGSKHVFTPDADNITKLIKDALNGVAYKDDAQVFEIVTRKVWSDHSRTQITLEFME